MAVFDVEEFTKHFEAHPISEKNLKTKLAQIYNTSASASKS